MMQRTGEQGGGGGSRPLIGITADVVEPAPGKVRVQCSVAYADAVVRAGGLPVWLAPEVGLVGEQVGSMDGFVLTGGDDPRMEAFGEATHAAATVMHERRQAYEMALVRELLARPQVPVLGICLGMQMMALVSGGRLDQHLPDRLATAEMHRGDRVHAVRPEDGSWLAAGAVTSHHRQAVSEAGPLRVVARSEDGVIEAVERAGGAMCLGVQWHPERTADAALGDGLFRRLVQAARGVAERRGRGAC